MKKLVSIPFLFSFFCSAGQNLKKCDSGYAWMPTINTSSLRIVADTCLPDSICKSLWIEFHKSGCGESQFVMGDEHYQHGNINTWVNDSIGCVSNEFFKKKVGKKWIDISKCEYYMLVKTECWVTNEKYETLIIPCCGHKHPANDWKTVIQDK